MPEAVKVQALVESSSPDSFLELLADKVPFVSQAGVLMENIIPLLKTENFRLSLPEHVKGCLVKGNDSLFLALCRERLRV